MQSPVCVASHTMFVCALVGLVVNVLARRTISVLRDSPPLCISCIHTRLPRVCASCIRVVLALYTATRNSAIVCAHSRFPVLAVCQLFCVDVCICIVRNDTRNPDRRIARTRCLHVNSRQRRRRAMNARRLPTTRCYQCVLTIASSPGRIGQCAQ